MFGLLIYLFVHLQLCSVIGLIKPPPCALILCPKDQICEDGQCVTICKENEEFKECGTQCELTCRHPKDEGCTDGCVLNVCQCKKGYYRNDGKRCVEYSECRIPITCAEVNCPCGQKCTQEPWFCIWQPCGMQSPKCGGKPITCVDVKCPVGSKCKQDMIACIKEPCDQPPPYCKPQKR